MFSITLTFRSKIKDFKRHNSETVHDDVVVVFELFQTDKLVNIARFIKLFPKKSLLYNRVLLSPLIVLLPWSPVGVGRPEISKQSNRDDVDDTSGIIISRRRPWK